MKRKKNFKNLPKKLKILKKTYKKINKKNIADKNLKKSTKIYLVKKYSNKKIINFI